MPTRRAASPLRLDQVSALVLLAAWVGVTTWRALTAHWSLVTNAFDLSIFDFALWNSLHGRLGFVPFLGQSIFSQHFMPVLLLLAPGYALFPAPVALILFQIAVMASAGWLFFQFTRRIGVNTPGALGLLATFLLCRPSHSALTSFFYPECLQAALMFALVAVWNKGGWAYWVIALLLLMTKEDAALYLGAFAALQIVLAPRTRRRSAGTLLLSAAWLVVALTVAIPMSRVRDGLPKTNPLIEDRFAVADGGFRAGMILERIGSTASTKTITGLLLSAGLLPLGGIQWLAAVAPGVLANLAAKPGSGQAALTGHYAWPILPWLFMGAATGLLKIQQRSVWVAHAWVGLLVCVTVADSADVRGVASTRRDPAAQIVLEQLEAVQGQTVLAQPNLIPHLSRSTTVFALGYDTSLGEQAPVVALTKVGNLWPFDTASVDQLIHRYESDRLYDEVIAGPLYLFRRRPAS